MPTTRPSFLQSAADLVASAEVAAALSVHLSARTGAIDIPVELAGLVAKVAETVELGQPSDDDATAAAWLRTVLAQAAAFAATPAQPPAWEQPDPAVLRAQGQASASFARVIEHELAPRLGDLAPRLAAGGAILDVGVGVGALSIALALRYRSAHVTGIDVWEPSLRIADHDVRAAGLAERITLRLQDVAQLDDRKRYDLVWFSGPFIGAATLHAALQRCAAALAPGGWLLYASYRGHDPRSNALADLRTHRSGGVVLSDAEIVTRLHAAGLTDAHPVDVASGVPAGFVAARQGSG